LVQDEEAEQQKSERKGVFDMTWLDRIFRRNMANKTPDSMTDMRRSDPCWCGSGRRYASCHRKEDRRRMRELGIDKDGLRSNPFV
jgi:hypothetical protein